VSRAWFALVVLCGASAAGQNDAMSEPLAREPGRAETGREIFVDRATGHCVLCHRVAGVDAPFQGDLGPDLSDVGARLSPAQIRYRIVDASRLNPATIMPPYYRTDSLNQVANAYRAQTVLSGEQIEHLVAYLSSLTSPRP
jgi:sulfur-oxidizing protein SoxX